jgi:hypothetical protein
VPLTFQEPSINSLIFQKSRVGFPDYSLLILGMPTGILGLPNRILGFWDYQTGFWDYQTGFW